MIKLFDGIPALENGQVLLRRLGPKHVDRRQRRNGGFRQAECMNIFCTDPKDAEGLRAFKHNRRIYRCLMQFIAPLMQGRGTGRSFCRRELV